MARWVLRQAGRVFGQPVGRFIEECESTTPCRAEEHPILDQFNWRIVDINRYYRRRTGSFRNHRAPDLATHAALALTNRYPARSVRRGSGFAKRPLNGHTRVIAVVRFRYGARGPGPSVDLDQVRVPVNQVTLAVKLRQPGPAYGRF